MKLWSCGALWAVLCSVQSLAGIEITVGPQGTFQTIAAAAAVAQKNDIIVIDPGPASSPYTYPPLTLSGANYSLVSAEGSERPVQLREGPAGQPVLQITGTPSGESVTLFHFAIEVSREKAILLDQNQGAVRFGGLEVSPTGSLANFAGGGIIDISRSSSVWISHLDMILDQPASYASPQIHHGLVDGVAAIEVRNDSFLLLQSSTVVAPSQIGTATRGGDGVRLINSSRLRLTGFSRPSQIDGGNGDGYGGAGVRGLTTGSSPVLGCGIANLKGGGQGGKTGQNYAPGWRPGGTNTQVGGFNMNWRGNLPYCAPYAEAAVWTPKRELFAGSHSFTYGQRMPGKFALYVGPPAYTPRIAGISLETGAAGGAWLPFTAAHLAAKTVFSIGSGLHSGAGSTPTFELNIPALQLFNGKQWTVQGLSAVAVGPQTSVFWSDPVMALVRSEEVLQVPGGDR